MVIIMRGQSEDQRDDIERVASRGSDSSNGTHKKQITTREREKREKMKQQKKRKRKREREKQPGEATSGGEGETLIGPEPDGTDRDGPAEILPSFCPENRCKLRYGMIWYGCKSITQSKSQSVLSTSAYRISLKVKREKEGQMTGGENYWLGLVKVFQGLIEG